MRKKERKRHRGKERDRAGASNIWTTDTYHKLLFFSLQFSLPFLLKPLFLFRLTGPGSMRGNEILYEVRHEISRAWMIYAIALHRSPFFRTSLNIKTKRIQKPFFSPRFPRMLLEWCRSSPGGIQNYRKAVWNWNAGGVTNTEQNNTLKHWKTPAYIHNFSEGQQRTT